MWAYDMWSAGVVWLELVLGTPHVFHISAAQRARLDARLDLSRKAAADRQLVYLLRGMMEMCLYPQVSCWSRAALWAVDTLACIHTC